MGHHLLDGDAMPIFYCCIKLFSSKNKLIGVGFDTLNTQLWAKCLKITSLCLDVVPMVFRPFLRVPLMVWISKPVFILTTHWNHLNEGYIAHSACVREPLYLSVNKPLPPSAYTCATVTLCQSSKAIAEFNGWNEAIRVMANVHLMPKVFPSVWKKLLCALMSSQWPVGFRLHRQSCSGYQSSGQA